MWTIVNDFHIEKTRLPVVVVATSGERLSGDLFVHANARNASGYEGADDVLNAGEAFFPLATLSGRVLLHAKSQVRELHVPGGQVDEESALGARAEVVIALSGGHRLKGTMVIELETARQRVLDSLNRLAQRFLRLHTAEGLIFVNSDFIAYVEQVQ